MTQNAINARLPVQYSPEVALAICEELATGKSLVEVCSAEGMPTRQTVYRWLSVYPKFFDAYERAREVSAQSLEDEALGLARDLTAQNDYTGTKVQALNIAMQQLRWSAAHRDRARYGERAQANTSVPITINTTLNLGQDGKPATDIATSVYTISVEAQVAAAPQPDPFTIDMDAVPGDNPPDDRLPFGLPAEETQQLHNPKMGRPKGTAKGVVGHRKSASATKRTATVYSKKENE